MRLRVYANNTTDLSVGDTFRFRGLSGQRVEEQMIVVNGVTVDGFVACTLTRNPGVHDAEDPEENEDVKGLRLPLDVAVAMVEQRIWHHSRMPAMFDPS